MTADYKKRILQIDVTVQKIFLYWLVLGLITAIVCVLFYWTSFFGKSIIDFLGTSLYIITISLFLFLPALGVLNLIFNFLYFIYGSYSDEVLFLRRVYGISLLALLILIGIYAIMYFGFSYVILDWGNTALVILLITAFLFAESHSYITLLENRTREDLELYDKIKYK